MVNSSAGSYPNWPSTNDPINHTPNFASSEAGPLLVQQGSSLSQPSSSSEVPELYYDQELSTPPSTTSSDLLRTPPHGWSAVAPTSSLHDARNAFTQPAFKSIPFDTSRGSRPTVPPINTNFNWKNNPQPKSIEPSMLFANYDSSPSYHTNSNLYYRPSLNTLPIRDTSSFSNGSVPVSPLSHVSPSEPKRSPRPVQQAPLKLHQPRPSRRIPIISLSTLASGCDVFAQPSNNEQTSEELLSPLPLEFNAPATASLRLKREYHSQHNAKSSQHTGYVPTFGSSGDSGKVIMCSCGCMESYTFH